MVGDMYRFEWLAQRSEAAVDPEREIVDAHHHLWEHRRGRYLAEELQADTGATHNVVQTVFVECMAKYDREADLDFAPIGETAFVAGEAERCAATGGSTIAAIVSFADMMLGEEVEDVLVGHEEAGRGLFRGIRHATAIDPDIGRSHTQPTGEMMETLAFRAGLATLAARGHSFDAWLYHPQLHELLAMARALPELSIVLDHLGGPVGVGRFAGREEEVTIELRRSLSEIATCPNVVLKLGGIGMDDYFGTGWASLAVPPDSDTVADRWGDQLRWSIDTFGPDRCMFESNFPVDRETLTYPVLWNALQKIASPYSDSEQDQLFSGTARRVYRIE